MLGTRRDNPVTMARDVREYVAGNTQQIRRIDTRFIEVAGEQRQQHLAFTGNEFEVTITVEVYSRDLQDGLYSGHPAAKHGSGRGVAGDKRGAWTQEFSGATTKAFTRGGRNAVRDSLDGQTGAPETAALGTGTTDADVRDSALVTETDTTWTYGVKDAATETRTKGEFRFHQHPDTIEEWGVKDGSGRLLARATETVTTTNEKELRLDVTFSISGSGAGSTVVTDAGEKAVADSIRSAATAVGLEEIAFGTGTASFSKSSTGLTTEEYRKKCQRILEAERITARIWTAEDEPSGVTSSGTDLTEIEVTDNNGNAVFLARFDAFTKTDEFSFLAEVDFRIR